MSYRTYPMKIPLKLCGALTPFVAEVTEPYGNQNAIIMVFDGRNNQNVCAIRGLSHTELHSRNKALFARIDGYGNPVTFFRGLRFFYHRPIVFDLRTSEGKSNSSIYFDFSDDPKDEANRLVLALSKNDLCDPRAEVSSMEIRGDPDTCTSELFVETLRNFHFNVSTQ